jgi:hypothetical protein
VSTKRFLVFVVILFVMGTFQVFGQWANSGSLTIVGNMPTITQVNVTDLETILTLDVAQTDEPVATVAERSNVPAGYTVSVSSANGGKLVSATTGEEISYTLKYGTSEPDLTTANTW